MNSISTNDRIFLIKCYYSNNDSATAALRQFKKERNLIKDPFGVQSILNLVKKFEETGTIHDLPKSGRPSQQDERTAAVEEALRNDVSDIDCSSTRRIAKATSIPHTSVYNIIRHKLKTLSLSIYHGAGAETNRSSSSTSLHTVAAQKLKNVRYHIVDG